MSMILHHSHLGVDFFASGRATSHWIAEKQNRVVGAQEPPYLVCSGGEKTFERIIESTALLILIFYLTVPG